MNNDFDTPQKGLHKTMGIYEGTSEDQYDDMFPQQIVLLFFLLLPFKWSQKSWNDAGELL